jgi:hypothetical protein
MGNKQHDLHLKPKQDTALVDSEAAWLRAQKADVVICGAVPFGCAAAAAAGICAVYIANSTGGKVAVRHTTAYPGMLAVACICWLHATNCMQRLPWVQRTVWQQEAPHLSCMPLSKLTKLTQKLCFVSACGLHLCQIIQRKCLQTLCMGSSISLGAPTHGTMALDTRWPPFCYACLGMLQCCPSTTSWTSLSLCLMPSSAKSR